MFIIGDETCLHLSVHSCPRLAPAVVRDSVRLGKPLPFRPLFLRSRALEALRLVSALPLLDLAQPLAALDAQLSPLLTDSSSHVVCESVLCPLYAPARARRIPVVSTDFLHACLREGMVVDASPYLLRPFTGLVITVTGLSQVTRRKLEGIILELGGVYSPDLRRTSTHLIAETAGGVKYRYAMAWQVSVVRLAWLFACSNAQECLSAEQFALTEDQPEDDDSSFWLSEPFRRRKTAPSPRFPLPLNLMNGGSVTVVAKASSGSSTNSVPAGALKRRLGPDGQFGSSSQGPMMKLLKSRSSASAELGSDLESAAGSQLHHVLDLPLSVKNEAVAMVEQIDAILAMIPKYQ